MGRRVQTVSANRLLILDDDPGVLSFLAEVGRERHYEVALSATIDELRACYESFDPSLIILDLQYAEGDGIEVLSFLKRRGCKVPIMLISGFDARVLESARRVGLEYGLTIVDALEKPVRLEALARVLESYREPESDEWTAELRQAIPHGQIAVYYQPKVDLADGRLVGFEALARWHHPTRGTIEPDLFIPLAEASGLIAALTDEVLVQAVGDCASWALAGDGLTVAVNMSPQLLLNDDLLSNLVQLLGQHRLPPARLTLEVTESAAMQDPGATMGILSRLRLRGFGLALDDFGTGYSNLAILHRMPFNELKIDRSFVADVKESRDSQVIVRAIAALAQQLGLATVAEGVEDLSIWEWLRATGIAQVQGFGIARPMPGHQVPDWLNAYRPLGVTQAP
jgi:EAL domain-containing protein (putative c-di-GMP-specific phosphodiesterase class I)/ActR/RegA family two-component response regulator